MAKKQKPIDETVEEVQEEATENVVLEEEEKGLEAKDLLAQKDKQCAEYLDRLQRTMAEFDNFRKRTAKEKASMYEDGVRDTILKIVPVVDNLQRALGASEQKGEGEGLVQGVTMILRQFEDILTGLGVEEIPAVGETFDPNLHYAVSHIEDENYGENEVTEELQKGYLYKEKVIRHSMVKVAN